MKKFTLFLLSLFILFLSNSAFPKPVDVEQAEKAAYNFLYARADNNIKSNLDVILYKVISDNVTKMNLYYIFNIKPQGFIIITADNNLTPVVAYSFEDNYVDNKNPVEEMWVKAQIKLATQNIIEDKKNNSKWLSILNNISTKGIETVPPLCTTKWNQDTYYNFMCPVDSNGPDNHAYAGCVATAMGQVMKYWNHPINGTSGYAYQHIWPMFFHNYGTVEANFAATTYNWSNMPNTINNSNKIDVATLLFHCGVSVKTDYGPDGSGAQTESIPFALSHYFKYNEAVTYLERNFNPGRKWDSIIMGQLNKGFPMVYSGASLTDGHAWVVDGYQDSSYFHINWGWSGWNNGYFYFDNLNSGNGDFTNSQAAVINIFPKDYVSIDDHELKQFSLYPNPAKNYFTINNVNNEFNVDIMNIKGMTIKSVANNKVINTSGMDNGLYFVKITQGNMQRIIKLLILKN